MKIDFANKVKRKLGLPFEMTYTAEYAFDVEGKIRKTQKVVLNFEPNSLGEMKSEI